MMNMLKKNKTSRALIAGAILIAVMLAAAACSNNNNNGEQPSPSIEPTPVVSATPEPTDNGGVTEPGEATPDEDGAATEEPVNTAPTDAPSMKGEGVFVGLADTHTVEIETSGGAQSYQFEDSLSDAINAIQSNANVTFEYVEKKIEADGQSITQLWLTKIEASN